MKDKSAILTIAEAAEELGFKPRAVYNLAARGALRVVHVPGTNRLRVRRSSLERFKLETLRAIAMG